MAYDAAKAGGAEAVWFTPGPWVRSWSLGEDWSLVMQIKTARAKGQENWSVALVDQAARRTASRVLEFEDGSHWNGLELSLKGFKADVV